MLRVVADDDASAELVLDLDPICREGARRMLVGALEAERDAYLAALAEEVDERGHRLVVGNGHARPRVIATGAGRLLLCHLRHPLPRPAALRRVQHVVPPPRPRRAVPEL